MTQPTLAQLTERIEKTFEERYLPRWKVDVPANSSIEMPAAVHDYVSATEDIKSFLVASLAEVARETVKACEVEEYTFKKVDWGDGIITDEPVEDETKPNAYATGYNAAISEQRSRAEGWVNGV